MRTSTKKVRLTWSEVLPIYVEAAVNGMTIEGREAAWHELRDLAAFADKQNARIEKKRKKRK